MSTDEHTTAPPFAPFTEPVPAPPAAQAPPPERVFTDRDFWGGGDLDLDAYLSRVGLSGELPPTPDTLAVVHRAHLAAIPFENLNLVLGRSVRLDVPSLTDKMVHHRRGGYCYEQNLLLAAVLDRLGFPLTAFSARVLMGGDGRPRPSTHALLRVAAEGGPWLADVGFGGGGLVEPFPFADGHQVSQGGWNLRLDRISEVGDEEWLLRGFNGRRWQNLYSFSTAGNLPQDYGIFSHYLTTHPRSPFGNRLMAARTTGGTRYALTNTTLTVDRVDGTGEVRELALGEVGPVLREVFDIDLDQQEQSIVQERVRGFLSMG
ncbi:arylamine N-acetyltransferase [Nocardiopsis terrae]|uniref:N-hydroxyarylamine O-acetyltransferase n=1 Tax=Nocardiopsis terrae TaxID=372655 RepID=A0ABR9HK77_9ACTN|nr:arylamine N-acetyltransferase [Nocardiopsis terrae]MBE1459419.1 N-hydroxyarylamine O-acetyltransferase [Nocardiopsis terrae]GHC97184.1 arylamine N-acetyltransferase [Nocardiopsis terrae]